MKKILPTLLIIFLFYGCAHKAQKVESFISPEIGTEITKGVGENLFTQGFGQLIPILTIQEDTQIGTFILKKGIYQFNDKNSSRMKFQRDEQDIYFYTKRTNEKICLDTGAWKEKCSEVKFTVGTILANKQSNSFQQSLIYNGKIQNKITLGYREFSGEIARAAFSNEVSYDLSDSSTLGYKGARIEVIKATNTEITYKVLSGFN